MNNLKNIRFKQRFQNFEKAYKLLEKYIEIKNPNVVEQAGGIQFFQMAFELSWKTMKDYLECEGFIVSTPRETIKQAFQINLIKDGHLWLEALDNRNITVHTYDETKADIVEKNIREKFFFIIKSLYEYLKKV